MRATNEAAGGLTVNLPTMTEPLTLREAAALIALHGELASQGNGVDWSDRPQELAETVTRYADEVVRALDAQKG